jgi:hypothetical protein
MIRPPTLTCPPVCRQPVGGLDLTRSCGHRRGSASGLVEGHGADPSEVAVAPPSIVKHFNIVEQVSPCLVAGFVDSLSNAFLLQAAEERLGNGIIVTVASPAHAGDKPMGAAEAHPVVAAVAFIGQPWQKRGL